MCTLSRVDDTPGAHSDPPPQALCPPWGTPCMQPPRAEAPATSSVRTALARCVNRTRTLMQWCPNECSETGTRVRSDGCSAIGKFDTGGLHLRVRQDAAGTIMAQHDMTQRTAPVRGGRACVARAHLGEHHGAGGVCGAHPRRRPPHRLEVVLVLLHQAPRHDVAVCETTRAHRASRRASRSEACERPVSGRGGLPRVTTVSDAVPPADARTQSLRVVWDSSQRGKLPKRGPYVNVQALCFGWLIGIHMPA